MSTTTPWHRVKLLLSFSLLVGVVSSCASSEARSAARFCSTLHSEKERILAQLETNGNPETGDDMLDVLGGLGASVQALGELRTYFRKLSTVAPDEIRHEAELVAEQMDQQLESAGDAMSNPLGALASSLLGGLATSGQLGTLDNFARTNCDESI